MNYCLWNKVFQIVNISVSNVTCKNFIKIIFVIILFTTFSKNLFKSFGSKTVNFDFYLGQHNWCLLLLLINISIRLTRNLGQTQNRQDVCLIECGTKIGAFETKQNETKKIFHVIQHKPVWEISNTKCSYRVCLSIFPVFLLVPIVYFDWTTNEGRPLFKVYLSINFCLIKKK